MRNRLGNSVGLFSTPVITEWWDGAKQHNAPLKRSVLERASTAPGRRFSNVLGWQSDTDMLAWGGESARRLNAHVMSRCQHYTRCVAPNGGPGVRWGSEMWANLSTRGSSNEAHVHPGSYWSAVYYVDDGRDDGAEDPDVGGELVFFDPRMPYVRMTAPDLRRRRANGEADHHEIRLRAETGRLILFPSWLMHSVRPYLGDRQRISLALNVVAFSGSGA